MRILNYIFALPCCVTLFLKSVDGFGFHTKTSSLTSTKQMKPIHSSIANPNAAFGGAPKFRYSVGKSSTRIKMSDKEEAIEEDDEDDEDDAYYMSSSYEPGTLAVSENTNLLLGINKYSHDVSVCAADQDTGEVLFFLQKERLSRKKYDAGNVQSIVHRCLECLELDLVNVKKVVVNNHHHRVLPLEKNLKHLEWQEGLGINCDNDREMGGLCDDENLLPDCDDKHEISHHLAHAYSVATQAPFSKGLVVIMDGMGETYRTMAHAKRTEDSTYTSDLDFLTDNYSYQNVPSDIAKRAQESIWDWREGESAYVFEKDESGISLKPIFKRWIEEKTPPTLYNHGFENMESVGAVYSRASSHVFGDWNACGKVMGLAPWSVYSWEELPDDLHQQKQKTMEGKLYVDDDFKVHTHEQSMVGTPLNIKFSSQLMDEKRKRYDFDDVVKSEMNDRRPPVDVAIEAISLASSVQKDLEDTVIDFVKYLKDGELVVDKELTKNLCLAGGVALNSVLNGRLSRELGFENTFIPPYPGDDGVSVGCAAFGLFGNKALAETKSENKAPSIWQKPLSPYLGPYPEISEIDEALADASPWLDIEPVRNDQRRFEIMAREVASGGIVAWYHGRSESGPRALGHRSILADPRKKDLVRFINNFVKMRESFRPFAPSVLAEHAHEWFEGIEEGEKANVSPYMSITAIVKEEKRSLIPSVTHIDGSSRLQTVTPKSEPSYHKFIYTFFKETGVPMVLNTSFNTLKGEPIVESPKEAIRSFLCSMGAIEMLVIGDNIVRRKPANVRKLLGEKSPKSKLISPPVNPVRAGPIFYQSESAINEDLESDFDVVTKVKMPDRPMHDETNNGGWFDLLDDFEGQLLGLCDGSVNLEDILEEFHPEATGDKKDAKFDQAFFENVMKRLVRLYEHSFISW